MYGQHRQDAARLATEKSQKEKEVEKENEFIHKIQMDGSSSNHLSTFAKDKNTGYNNDGFEPDVYNSKL